MRPRPSAGTVACGIVQDRVRQRVAEVDPRGVERADGAARLAAQATEQVGDVDLADMGNKLLHGHAAASIIARVYVAAAAELGFGDASHERHRLPAPSARTVVDGLDPREVLGQDRVAGIALGQCAERLRHPHLAVGDDLPGCGVAHDDVGGVRGVEESSFALDEHGPDLLGHAVEVVHPLHTGYARELGLVLLGANRLVGQLLPAAGVDQDRVLQIHLAGSSAPSRCSQTMNVKPKIRIGESECRLQPRRAGRPGPGACRRRGRRSARARTSTCR